MAKKHRNPSGPLTRPWLEEASDRSRALTDLRDGEHKKEMIIRLKQKHAGSDET